MALNIAYVLFANGQVACNQAPLICGTNPRPVSLVPHYFAGTDDVDWSVEPARNDAWSTVTGARNGIAVTTGLGITVFDIQGDGTSDEEENTPYSKLAAFLSQCCIECDEDTIFVDGEYNGTFPALGATSFCFNVTITGVTDYPTAYDLNLIALKVPDDFLASDVKFVSYNAGTDVLIVNMCLKIDVTSTGAPLGFPETWTFADA